MNIYIYPKNSKIKDFISKNGWFQALKEFENELPKDLHFHTCKSTEQFHNEQKRITITLKECPKLETIQELCKIGYYIERWPFSEWNIPMIGFRLSRIVLMNGKFFHREKFAQNRIYNQGPQNCIVDNVTFLDCDNYIEFKKFIELNDIKSIEFKYCKNIDNFLHNIIFPTSKISYYETTHTNTGSSILFVRLIPCMSLIKNELFDPTLFSNIRMLL